MKAVVYRNFKQTPKIESMPDPQCADNGVVIKVEATGVCRSDWHGWMGHDADIVLPHIPGHELAGTIATIGKNVKHWQLDARVTVPFVGGCGHCPQCHNGDQQVCDNQFQPGFTHFGSFAQYVFIDYADENLVQLPDNMDFATAASLGCRFVTAFRAVVDQGRTKQGDWVAVHGCGGVGLSAIMIAKAQGAQVVAIDIDDKTLKFAKNLGADKTINSQKNPQVAEAIKALTNGGANVSLDALGHTQTCLNSIACLAKRGRHIQVGLMLAAHSTPNIPMGPVIANELEILGSHGMQAHKYGQMFEMIEQGLLHPKKLLGQKINLEQSIDVLTNMDKFQTHGVSVITEF
ncbi:MAG: alcohol dehydrogenase [Hyphomicrobiales bacterium]|nr:MAG: alcohol dehydrogenase [Hyphomicrobiales bacterium]